MSTKNKSHKNRRRGLEKISVTKTLEDTQKREPGKSGKILTLDYVGMPCYGKIVKLEGFHPETPTISEIVPIYQSCKSCGLFMGHLEVINSKELDNMCIDCFSEETQQKVVFSINHLHQKPCTSCGISIENENESYSKLPGKCNHCYLKIAGLADGHACIHCDPEFPMPEDDGKSLKKEARY